MRKVSTPSWQGAEELKRVQDKIPMDALNYAITIVNTADELERTKSPALVAQIDELVRKFSNAYQSNASLSDEDKLDIFNGTQAFLEGAANWARAQVESISQEQPQQEEAAQEGIFPVVGSEAVKAQLKSLNKKAHRIPPKILEQLKYLVAVYAKMMSERSEDSVASFGVVGQSLVDQGFLRGDEQWKRDVRSLLKSMVPDSVEIREQTKGLGLGGSLLEEQEAA